MSGSELNPQEIARLKQLALAATPGPWDHYGATGEGNYVCTFNERADGFRTVKGCVVPGYKVKYQDLEFIAALNPETVLKLIETVERYREALEFYASHSNWVQDRIHSDSDNRRDGVFIGPFAGGKRARAALSKDSAKREGGE